MKRMTFDEIKKTYPNEWVLIAEPDTDRSLRLVSGVVLAHSPHRDEVYKALKGRRGQHAVRFTGEMKGKVFVL